MLLQLSRVCKKNTLKAKQEWEKKKRVKFKFDVLVVMWVDYFSGVIARGKAEATLRFNHKYEKKYTLTSS